MIDMDLETRSRLNVVKHGVYVHSKDPELEILSLVYSLDEAPADEWRGRFGGDALGVNDSDPQPTALLDAIENGDLIWAWNAAYERLVWNACALRLNWPQMRLEQVLCASAFARSHNLPGGLKDCAKVTLPANMQKKENTAYKKLWSADNPIGDDDFDLYEEMVDYNYGDVGAMRGILNCLPAPSDTFTKEYHASEQINDRGVMIDRDWCNRAAAMKDMAAASLNSEIDYLTGGAVSTVKQTAKARQYVQGVLVGMDRLDEGQDLVRGFKKRRPDGTGFFTETRATFDKNMRAELRVALDDDASEDAQHIIDLLDVIDEGAGAAASKYAKALAFTTAEDPVLRGMYMFNGANQTGRYASTGMQTHNMIRKVLPGAVGIMDDLVACKSMAGVRAYLDNRDDLPPIHTAIGRLLRPTLIASENCAFCWSDWSAIEARGAPWLANSPDGERVLDYFRNGQDVYLIEASNIFEETVDDPEDPRRQIGKVAVLSLGYGGGKGAFLAMARNYGLTDLDPKLVTTVINKWRDANAWATDFWDELSYAAISAVSDPGTPYAAGRVTYIFLPDLLSGSLVCFLPCGRPILYPYARVKRVERFDDQWEDAVVFRHPRYGLSSLWHGTLIENITQGAAASLLRDVLRRLEDKTAQGLLVGATVAHTHDEVVQEIAVRDAEAAAAELQKEMLYVPPAFEGLPLDADVSVGYNYYQSEEL